jgi:hypothetical protein
MGKIRKRKCIHVLTVERIRMFPFDVSFPRVMVLNGSFQMVNWNSTDE